MLCFTVAHILLHFSNKPPSWLPCQTLCIGLTRYHIVGQTRCADSQVLSASKSTRLDGTTGLNPSMHRGETGLSTSPRPRQRARLTSPSTHQRTFQTRRHSTTSSLGRCFSATDRCGRCRCVLFHPCLALSLSLSVARSLLLVFVTKIFNDRTQITTPNALATAPSVQHEARCECDRQQRRRVCARSAAWWSSAGQLCVRKPFTGWPADISNDGQLDASRVSFSMCITRLACLFP